MNDNFENMSRAFVKDSDDEPWLDEISPTMKALTMYLTRQNGGRKVFEEKNYTNEDSGKEIHVMSNGLSYFLNEDGRWQVLPE